MQEAESGNEVCTLKPKRKRILFMGRLLISLPENKLHVAIYYKRETLNLQIIITADLFKIFSTYVDVNMKMYLFLEFG